MYGSVQQPTGTAAVHLQFELTSPHACEESPPLVWARDQHWSVRVLGVPDGDYAGEVAGDFDAVALCAAVAALVPDGALQRVGGIAGRVLDRGVHHVSLVTSSIRRTVAAVERADARRCSNTRVYRATSSAVSR